MAPLPVIAEGVTTYKVRSTDVVGHVEAPKTVTIRIDTAVPTITPATLSPAPNAAGWSSTDVTVTLHGGDTGGSGVQKTQYAPHGSSAWADANSGGRFTVSGPATHSNDGVHTYDYRAVDNAGNYSDLGIVTVNIDTTAPVTAMSSSQSSGWRRTPIRVKLTGGDSTSGVATTQYRLQGTSAWTPYTAPFQIDTQGAATYEYRSLDVAGNAETPKTFGTHIDSQAPSTTAYAAKAKHKKRVGLAYKVSDPSPGCGSAAVTLKIFKRAKLKKTLHVGSAATNVKASYKWRCTLAAGKYTVKVYATDIAGNVQKTVGAAKLTVK